MRDTVITMAHGGGGKAQNELIEEIILPRFTAPELASLPDAALTAEDLVISSDSFVVTPRFFPGGSLGTLAVTGSVNDVLMAGGIPRYLTCSLILEEGLAIAELEKILDDMSRTASAGNVSIVTGDTKVVPHGAGDGIYVNTAGIGFKRPGMELGRQRLEAGDRIVVSGSVGEHAMTITALRHDLDCALQSDCRVLRDCVEALCSTPYGMGAVKFMRDATRGGVYGILQEMFSRTEYGATLQEAALPVLPETLAIAKLLGIDPGFAACEGRLVAVVKAQAAEACVEALRKLPGCGKACILGEVSDQFSGVRLETEWGALHNLRVPRGGQLPRIC